MLKHVTIANLPMYKIKKLLRKIETKIMETKGVEIEESNINFFIFRIRLKWILNNTIISKFYFIFKPLIKLLLNTNLTNIIKNKIKFLN